MTRIAALFVEPEGCYAGIDGVDVWGIRATRKPRALRDDERDATLYAGPHPIVAHPPCARWCRMAHLVEARWGHRVGDDGGTFGSALAAVRRWGGVLEHPAYSIAWKRYGLPRPHRDGGWTRGECGGYACHVEQGRYGHVARKATWLYAYGVELPDLRWGYSGPDQKSEAVVSWCGNRLKDAATRPRVGQAAAATPPEFRDALISIARSVAALAPPSDAYPLSHFRRGQMMTSREEETP